MAQYMHETDNVTCAFRLCLLRPLFSEAKIADPGVRELAGPVEIVVDPDIDAWYPARYEHAETLDTVLKLAALLTGGCPDLS